LTEALFHSHLSLAHFHWKQLIQAGDQVIDATCGNGNDTLFLSQSVLQQQPIGKVYALDIQKKAIEKTCALLTTHLSSEQMEHVFLVHSCHSQFLKKISPKSIQLIVYNLGYLPNEDKTVTTKTNTTLQSLKEALPLIKLGGAFSVTCYPGHEEGKKEQEALLPFFSSLPNKMWSVCHHTWVNRCRAPSLFLIQRRS